MIYFRFEFLSHLKIVEYVVCCCYYSPSAISAARGQLFESMQQTQELHNYVQNIRSRMAS